MTDAPDPSTEFTAALRDLHRTRRSTPCQYATARGDNPWMSPDAAERRRAADLCGPCPVLALCRESAVAEGTTDTVRGGIDFTDPATRRAAKRARRNAHTTTDHRETP